MARRFTGNKVLRKAIPDFSSCRSAQVEPRGVLARYFKSGYFEGEVFIGQMYKRVYTGEYFYEHEASGIKVWEHARLP